MTAPFATMQFCMEDHGMPRLALLQTLPQAARLDINYHLMLSKSCSRNCNDVNDSALYPVMDPFKGIAKRPYSASLQANSKVCSKNAHLLAFLDAHSSRLCQSAAHTACKGEPVQTSGQPGQRTCPFPRMQPRQNGNNGCMSDFQMVSYSTP